MRNRVATNAESTKRSQPGDLTCTISMKRSQPCPPNTYTKSTKRNQSRCPTNPKSTKRSQPSLPTIAISRKRSQWATNSVLASNSRRAQTVTPTRAESPKRSQTQVVTITQSHVKPSKRSHNQEVWVRCSEFADWLDLLQSESQKCVASPTVRTRINELGCSFLRPWRNSLVVAISKWRPAIQFETAPSRSSNPQRGQSESRLDEPA
jgi:hypothetical protein